MGGAARAVPPACASGSRPQIDVRACLVAGPEIRITATPDGTAPLDRAYMVSIRTPIADR